MKKDWEELMLDLLCKKAVYGLSENEEKQLAELQTIVGPGFETESFELTAAAIGMAGLDTRAKLPANLRSRIAADAERFFDEIEAASVDGRATTASPSRPNRFSLSAWLGWAIAAAACFALAVNLYTSRTGPVPGPQANELKPAQMRERLIATAPDLMQASWEAGKMESMKPAGDVVWSDSKQIGYMRLAGLPVNDTSRETYQLWIYDESQDPKTPIDGGVFDINSSGEVIIPINAKLKARNPKMFAITIEKPGGVVVSKGERVAALAKRETRSVPPA
jgi:anti-sigma-K factor RskA